MNSAKMPVAVSEVAFEQATRHREHTMRNAKVGNTLAACTMCGRQFSRDATALIVSGRREFACSTTCREQLKARA